MLFLKFLIAAVFVIAVLAQTMPPPFTRDLVYSTESEPMTGNDVLIAQTLLLRDQAVQSYNKASSEPMLATGTYDSSSSKATAAFQAAWSLPSTGILDAASATVLLDQHSADGYKDSGFSAASMGYLYKVHIPVHNNRSIETIATLFDKDNNVLMKFKARTHGHRGDGTTQPWPDFGDNDVGLNQFTTSGNTVTGLVEIDLNSPEPNPALYGPWPVNRLVRGLDGNAKLLLPNIRDGILIHTGNWTTADHGTWNPTMTMPNSAGCIHAHPTELYRIYETLVKIGVTVNENTFSGKNYPYKPQGIAVIELID